MERRACKQATGCRTRHVSLPHTMGSTRAGGDLGRRVQSASRALHARGGTSPLAAASQQRTGLQAPTVCATHTRSERHDPGLRCWRCRHTQKGGTTTASWIRGGGNSGWRRWRDLQNWWANCCTSHPECQDHHRQPGQPRGVCACASMGPLQLPRPRATDLHQIQLSRSTRHASPQGRGGRRSTRHLRRKHGAHGHSSSTIEAAAYGCNTSRVATLTASWQTGSHERARTDTANIQRPSDDSIDKNTTPALRRGMPAPLKGAGRGWGWGPNRP